MNKTAYQVYFYQLKGYSQADIARKMKIPNSKVSYWQKKLREMKIPSTLTTTMLNQIGEELLPILQSYFENLEYKQADFIISFLFYYLLHQYPNGIKEEEI